MFSLEVHQLLTTFAEVVALPLARIFVSYDTELLKVTIYSLWLFALLFLMAGFNMFASSFLQHSIMVLFGQLFLLPEHLLFQPAAVMILPLLFGVKGVWLAVTVSKDLNVGRYHHLLDQNAKDVSLYVIL